LVFTCAAFHDVGLLETFSSATDRFEVDSANAARQFLEHHGVPTARIQTAWDAIALHTTPGIAAYKPLEVELLYNGVGLDVLGIGYETFPEDLRTRVVAQYPRVNFKQDIAKAFLGGFEHKTPSTEGTCNEDICSHFIRNYKAAISTSRFNIHRSKTPPRAEPEQSAEQTPKRIRRAREETCPRTAQGEDEPCNDGSQYLDGPDWADCAEHCRCMGWARPRRPRPSPLRARRTSRWSSRTSPRFGRMTRRPSPL